jgi:hypothetical protein
MSWQSTQYGRNRNSGNGYASGQPHRPAFTPTRYADTHEVTHHYSTNPRFGRSWSPPRRQSALSVRVEIGSFIDTEKALQLASRLDTVKTELLGGSVYKDSIEFRAFLHEIRLFRGALASAVMSRVDDPRSPTFFVSDGQTQIPVLTAMGAWFLTLPPELQPGLSLWDCGALAISVTANREALDIFFDFVYG